MKEFELLEAMDPFMPGDFFSCVIGIPYAPDSSSPFSKQSRPLPDMSELLGTEKGGELFLAWNEGGILGKAVIDKPFEHSLFPGYEKGDALEVFIDTRDHKKTGFLTRFCHHFLFLGSEVEGLQAQEITRFRSEDTHPLCSSSDLTVTSIRERTSYTLFFVIAGSALHGYDPSQFSRLGFAFILHRHKAKPCCFPAARSLFDVAQHPSLWASITLN